LGDAIQSALMQTLKPIEVIVVNDGSEDNTSEVARKFPVTLIEQSNLGVAAARNIGSAVAEGKWLCCLDADDMLMPTYLERCLELENADIIAANVIFWQDDGIVATRKFKKVLSLEDLVTKNQLPVCSLHRRVMWEKLGGWHEMNGEDWDYWFRAIKSGYKTALVEDFLFVYRRHGKSRIDATIGKTAQIRQEIIERNGLEI
jgi:glycosyltransferase involved in cell wall biosynthesis